MPRFPGPCKSRAKHGKNPAPLAAADKWPRYYERFWSERLDMLETLLRADNFRGSETQEEGIPP